MNTPGKILVSETLEGLPLKAAYHTILKSDLFKEIELYSDSFLHQHADVLKDSKKWVQDPFHQWSRQYEYPFILSSIDRFASSHGGRSITILDAGSGITFFPHMLAKRYENSKIICCDYDIAYKDTFNKITEGSAVEYINADIRKTQFEDGTFDLIYCISVLEHLEDYAAVVKEFHRILKPGGWLSLTFDIDANTSGELSFEKADKILTSLCKHFKPIKPITWSHLRDHFKPADHVTTYYIMDLDKNLLPWNFTLWNKLKGLIKTGRWPRMRTLTFYCNVFVKE